ncbi:MAG: cupin domain-containing protein [Bacteroidetes bacterium]|nr:cupin domain-containing protein [Bacteroidota bacterium]
MKIEVEQLELEELEALNVYSWAIWEHDEDKFEWYYDQTEKCLIVAGEATIVSEFESITIKTGDFVTFPAGLECVWDIDSAIKKYYLLG